MADDRLRLECGCEEKYYSGIGWERFFCEGHKDLIMKEVELMDEKIDHPAHYNSYKGLEIIDLVEQMNFNRGNAVKYITRAGLKVGNLETEIEDLKKASWYIQREIQRISSETE